MDRPDPHDPDPRDLHARDPFRDPFSADPFPVTDANDPFRPEEPGATPAALAPRPEPGTDLLPAPPAQLAERRPAEATGRRSALGVLGPLLLVAGLICAVTGFLGFAAERAGPEGDDPTAPMVLFGVGTLALVTGTALASSGRGRADRTRGGVDPTATESRCAACGAPADDPGQRFCGWCGHRRA